MPSSRADLKRRSARRRPVRPSDQRSFWWRSTMSIQPSHCSSPSRVHSGGAGGEKRASVVGLPVGGGPSTAPRSSAGIASRKFITI